MQCYCHQRRFGIGIGNDSAMRQHCGSCHVDVLDVKLDGSNVESKR